MQKQLDDALMRERCRQRVGSLESVQLEQVSASEFSGVCVCVWVWLCGSSPAALIDNLAV